MTDPPSGADARLRDLEVAVARLSARLDAGERGAALPASEIAATEAVSVPAVATDAERLAPGWLGLVGRTCIVLGGAFLLRALTQSGQLPEAGGVWLGLAYSALWLALAGRAPGRSGFFHGLSALLVALPLVVEAALTFHVLSAGSSAAILAAIAVASLGVAWRRRQGTLAMLATLGTIAVTAALSFGLGTLLPSVLVLLVLGATTVWVGYARHWAWLSWPGAAAADFAILFLAIRASVDPPREGPIAAQAAHALFMVVYLGSFLIRIVLHERPLRLFEVAQTAAVLVIGLAGATAISHANHLGVSIIAFPCLVGAAIFYVQTFVRIAPRRGFGPEFYYVGTTALALTLVGLGLLFPYPARPTVVAIAALIASLVAWRFSQPMLALQGAIAAVVASAQSGLVTLTAAVWLTHTQPWPQAPLPIWIVLAAVSVALLIPRVVHQDEPPVLASIARVALSIVLVAGAGSLIVIGLGRVVSAAADPGVAATMKTVILTVAALGLAYVGRSPRFMEFRWLAYGVLAAGAMKFLLQDIRTSRPSTLFIAIAMYGVALIFVPRISKVR